MSRHKWQQVGENLYECTKCGCEVEGYGECIWACIPTKDKIDSNADKSDGQ